jgi:hypothetical protein
MRGVITRREVLTHLFAIVRLFGPRTYVRCLRAAFSARPTTFLEVVFEAPPRATSVMRSIRILIARRGGGSRPLERSTAVRAKAGSPARSPVDAWSRQVVVSDRTAGTSLSTTRSAGVRPSEAELFAQRRVTRAIAHGRASPQFVSGRAN